MVIAKKRLSPDQSRAAALNAARQLLISEGPQAVTLKAVAQNMGRTHANVLHHFGSASELQKALADLIASQVCEAITEVVLRARRGEIEPKLIVEMCFDAYDKQGFGPLVNWTINTGNQKALEPVYGAVLNLVDILSEGYDREIVAKNALNLVLLAMGNAMFGSRLAQVIGLPADAARELAYERLIQSPALARGRIIA